MGHIRFGVSAKAAKSNLGSSSEIDDFFIGWKIAKLFFVLTLKLSSSFSDRTCFHSDEEKAGQVVTTPTRWKELKMPSLKILRLTSTLIFLFCPGAPAPRRRSASHDRRSGSAAGS